jgi:hypothetical protein
LPAGALPRSPDRRRFFPFEIFLADHHRQCGMWAQLIMVVEIL